MADLSSDFELGEYSSRSVLESVEYTETIATTDVGTPLKITGVNSAGQLKVAKHTGTVRPAFIVIKGGEGKSGDIKAVLFHGDVKAKIGGTITAGDGITAKGGKIVTQSDNNAYPRERGFLRTGDAADGDTALICWG